MTVDLCCCNWHSPGGECILDVVSRGTELEPLRIRWGVWGGWRHFQIIVASRVWSSNFIHSLSSPFCDALQTQTNSSTKQLLYVHYHARGSRDKHSARPWRVYLLRRSWTNSELQKVYDWLNSAHHSPAEKEDKTNVCQPQSNDIHQLYNIIDAVHYIFYL
jgi:hypothetical protein